MQIFQNPKKSEIRNTFDYNIFGYPVESSVDNVTINVAEASPVKDDI